MQDKATDRAFSIVLNKSKGEATKQDQSIKSIKLAEGYSNDAKVNGRLVSNGDLLVSSEPTPRCEVSGR